ncbi:MAG: TIGR00300 family protein [Deltaproteobacteria bacterium]|nr:TIGR00300 family protein [Deltaproteobacteria bacterium]
MKEHSKVVEIKGHIIDSLILSKVFDEILARGGDYCSEEIDVGKTKNDSSYARIKVTAPHDKILAGILERLMELGAVTMEEEDADLAKATKDGVYPEGFYSSTNLVTKIKVENKWFPVDNISMDCGVKVDKENQRARCVKMSDVKAGDYFVISAKGVRVSLPERSKKKGAFQFMSSGVSSEKPMATLITRVAEEMVQLKKEGKGKILFVCGPAIIHTGSRNYMSKIIEKGYLDLLFAGNALAAHDIEASLYGTSLGVSLKKGHNVPEGHNLHLRAINTIRCYGGIKKAVHAGILNKGIMYTCIKEGKEFLLAGSIRDDGPLPEVITDVIEAQREMKKRLEGVEMAVMISTMLHSIAVGNLLPASVRTICVDINHATITKLIDRGTHQATGLVIDSGTFLRELCHRLP